LAGQQRQPAALQGAGLQRFEVYAPGPRLGLHDNPISQVAGAFGGVNQDLAPAVSEIDEVFRAAWADTTLSQEDLSNPLFNF